MNRVKITDVEIKETLFNLLGQITPEADFDELDPTDDLRDTLDIDSFDFLNFLIDINDELGVNIPKSDYGKLVSLNDLIEYLQNQ